MEQLDSFTFTDTAGDTITIRIFWEKPPPPDSKLILIERSKGADVKPAVPVFCNPPTVRVPKKEEATRPGAAWTVRGSSAQAGDGFEIVNSGPNKKRITVHLGGADGGTFDGEISAADAQKLIDAMQRQK